MVLVFAVLGWYHTANGHLPGGVMEAAMNMSGGAGRKLVLLRHAKSAWPDEPDHERPLARRGRRNAPVMGRWLRTAGHLPDQVLCSTARRARETWQLAEVGLGCTVPVSFDDRIYEGSAEILLDVVRHVSPARRTVLLVGHDPAVPELALMLAAAGPPAPADAGEDTSSAALLDRMRAKFPTAAVAVLDFGQRWDQLAPGSARLACFVTPRDPEAQPPR
jgi:phosphohistidine phosphatase